MTVEQTVSSLMTQLSRDCWTDCVSSLTTQLPHDCWTDQVQTGPKRRIRALRMSTGWRHVRCPTTVADNVFAVSILGRFVDTWLHSLGAGHSPVNINWAPYLCPVQYVGRPTVDAMRYAMVCLLLLLYVLATTKVISGLVPPCDSEHSW